MPPHPSPAALARGARFGGLPTPISARRGQSGAGSAASPRPHPPPPRGASRPHPLTPSRPARSVRRPAAANIQMNTKYTVAGGMAKKKKASDSSALRGYVVGSRAPPPARASGTTTAPTGYGSKLGAGTGKKVRAPSHGSRTA